jgi:hypothetical protein
VQMQPSAHKAYVGVVAHFSPTGQLMPISIEWEDGRKFDIDEITNVCRAASTKAGGAGIRYTVRIGRALRHLFLEEDKWFIERCGKE